VIGERRERGFRSGKEFNWGGEEESGDWEIKPELQTNRIKVIRNGKKRKTLGHKNI